MTSSSTISSIFDASAPPLLAPNDITTTRLTTSAHRKIELQSPEDWVYLLANVTRAASQTLDRHFPPDAAVRDAIGRSGGTTAQGGGDGGDVMRGIVEARVDEFIRHTFVAAKDSISINGLEAHEMEAELARVQGGGEELEPYDTRLAERIQKLSAQIENRTLELANLRRTAPADTARRFRAGFDAKVAQQDEALRSEEAAKMQAARDTRMDLGEVLRLDEMRRTWEQGTTELLALKAGLGSTVAKMEKAQETMKVIEGK